MLSLLFWLPCALSQSQDVVCTDATDCESSVLSGDSFQTHTFFLDNATGVSFVCDSNLGLCVIDDVSDLNGCRGTVDEEEFQLCCTTAGGTCVSPDVFLEGRCGNLGSCVYEVAITPDCVTEDECDPGTGVCDLPPRCDDNVCVIEPIPNCCDEDSDCDAEPRGSCETFICDSNSTCVIEPILDCCESDSECESGTGVCDLPPVCRDEMCVIDPIPNCCETDFDCETDTVGSCTTFRCLDTNSEPHKTCQQAIKADCQCVNNGDCRHVTFNPFCHEEPVCEDGRCTTSPVLVLGRPRQGCCSGVTGDLLSDCQILPGNCPVATGCQVNQDGFVDTFQCEYLRPQDTGCCLDNDNCVGVNGCFDEFCSDNICQLRGTDPEGGQCCRDVSECVDQPDLVSRCNVPSCSDFHCTGEPAVMGCTEDGALRGEFYEIREFSSVATCDAACPRIKYSAGGGFTIDVPSVPLYDFDIVVSASIDTTTLDFTVSSDTIQFEFVEEDGDDLKFRSMGNILVPSANSNMYEITVEADIDDVFTFTAALVPVFLCDANFVDVGGCTTPLFGAVLGSDPILLLQFDTNSVDTFTCTDACGSATTTAAPTTVSTTTVAGSPTTTTTTSAAPTTVTESTVATTPVPVTPRPPVTLRTATTTSGQSVPTLGPRSVSTLSVGSEGCTFDCSNPFELRNNRYSVRLTFSDGIVPGFVLFNTTGTLYQGPRDSEELELDFFDSIEFPDIFLRSVYEVPVSDDTQVFLDYEVLPVEPIQFFFVFCARTEDNVCMPPFGIDALSFDPVAEGCSTNVCPPVDLSGDVSVQGAGTACRWDCADAFPLDDNVITHFLEFRNNIASPLDICEILSLRPLGGILPSLFTSATIFTSRGGFRTGGELREDGIGFYLDDCIPIPALSSIKVGLTTFHPFQPLPVLPYPIRAIYRVPCTSVLGGDCVAPSRFELVEISTTVSYGEDDCSGSCSNPQPTTYENSFGGVFWFDTDRDNNLSTRESRAPGIVIDLVFSSNNTVFLVTTTNSRGYYLFSLTDGLTSNAFPRVRLESIPVGYEIGKDIGGAVTISGPARDGTLVESTPCEPEQGPFALDDITIDVMDDDCVSFDRSFSCTPVRCEGVAEQHAFSITHAFSSERARNAPASSFLVNVDPIRSPESIVCMDVIPGPNLILANALSNSRTDRSIAYGYPFGIPPGEYTIQAQTTVVYCSNQQNERFNITATVYGDECINTVERWRSCEPGVDPRACYHETQLQPSKMRCPPPALVVAPSVVIAPITGTLESTPYSIDLYESCGGPFCVTGELVSRDICAPGAVQVCEASKNYRGLKTFGASVTNAENVTSNSPLTIVLELERTGTLAPICGDTLPLYKSSRPPFRVLDEGDGTISFDILSMAALEVFSVNITVVECFADHELPEYSITARVESELCFLDDACSETLQTTFSTSCSNSECFAVLPRLQPPIDTSSAGEFAAVLSILSVLCLVCLCAAVSRSRVRVRPGRAGGRERRRPRPIDI